MAEGDASRATRKLSRKGNLSAHALPLSSATPIVKNDVASSALSMFFVIGAQTHSQSP